jgi:plastocyanin
MKLWRFVVAAGLFVALLPPIPAGAATRTVTIPDHSYSPERISIHIGGTVRWVNGSSDRHSVTATSDSRSRGESFDSNPNCDNGLLFSRCMRPGESFTHTFTTRGTFTYYCRRHGRDASYPDCGMCGRVTVVRDSSPTIVPTTPGSGGSTTPGSPSPSDSASPSVSPGSSTSTGSEVAAPGRDDSGGTSILAIAALGVALLGASGYFVYRTMIRR